MATSVPSPKVAIHEAATKWLVVLLLVMLTAFAFSLTVARKTTLSVRLSLNLELRLRAPIWLEQDGSIAWSDLAISFAE